jgi:chromosome segregation ATPase
MARRDFRVKARLEAEDQATPTVKKVESRFKRLGNTAKALRAHWFALTAAAAGLVLALKSVISASAEQELAVRKLDAALSPLGETAGAVSKELQEYAAALQKTTQFGDETIIAGQALIASFTKNTEEIKGATKAAIDLAAATGTNLHSAFLLLGRAASGETSTLSRYGITLDESVPKAEKFAAALAKIQEQFGGQAEAQAQTFIGQMAQLGNAFGDLKEAIGDSITQNDDATASLDTMKRTIEALIPLARRTGDVLKIMGDVIWNLALPLRAVAAATGRVTEAWLKLSGATDVVEASAGVFEATAKRLGVTVEELGVRLEKSRIATNDLNEDARKIKDTFTEDAAAINALVGGLRKMEEIAAPAAEKLEAVAEAVSDTGLVASETTEELDELSTATEKAGTAGDQAAEGFRRMKDAFAAAGVQAIRTSAQFDALAESAGRAVATAAAVEGGGRLGLGGTRVFLPGGGSRLTSEPGGRSSFASGGTFVSGGGRRAMLAADGRIIFV